VCRRHCCWRVRRLSGGGGGWGMRGRVVVVCARLWVQRQRATSAFCGRKKPKQKTKARTTPILQIFDHVTSHDDSRHPGHSTSVRLHPTIALTLGLPMKQCSGFLIFLLSLRSRGWVSLVACSQVFIGVHRCSQVFTGVHRLIVFVIDMSHMLRQRWGQTCPFSPQRQRVTSGWSGI
jgi:hypothetical protein